MKKYIDDGYLNERACKNPILLSGRSYRNASFLQVVRFFTCQVRCGGIRRSSASPSGTCSPYGTYSVRNIRPFGTSIHLEHPSFRNVRRSGTSVHRKLRQFDSPFYLRRLISRTQPNLKFCSFRFPTRFEPQSIRSGVHKEYSSFEIRFIQNSVHPSDRASWQCLVGRPESGVIEILTKVYDPITDSVCPLVSVHQHTTCKIAPQGPILSRLQLESNDP